MAKVLCNTRVAESTPGFQKKVWIASGIIAFIVLLLLIINSIFHILLLVLAGVLISVFFHGFGIFLSRKMKINRRWSLLYSIIISLVFLFVISWFIGSKVQIQIAELSDSFPAILENAENQLNKSRIGREIVETIQSGREQSLSSARGFFTTGFGIIADLYIILIISIFLTASPNLYTNGIVSMMPKSFQAKATNIISHAGFKLRSWLKGQIFAMFFVFILTSVGLSILGVPMALALGLIAGILNFIPNFGPLIALIPGVLVALLISPTTALIAAAIYTGVQIIESIVTPIIQNRLVQLPPALIIIFQVIMGALAGAMGVILATPFLVFLKSAVEILYLNGNNVKAASKQY
ncbi:MAG: AI-2E family transporter [Bacteroidota bacterium]|nr:AI-2E family transporter [Bacteroidota bacterium]